MRTTSGAMHLVLASGHIPTSNFISSGTTDTVLRRAGFVVCNDVASCRIAKKRQSTKVSSPARMRARTLFLPLARTDDRAILFATWNTRYRKVLRSRRAEDCSYFCTYRRQGTPPCTNGREERARASGLRREEAECSQKSEKSARICGLWMCFEWWARLDSDQ